MDLTPPGEVFPEAKGQIIKFSVGVVFMNVIGVYYQIPSVLYCLILTVNISLVFIVFFFRF